MSLTNSQLKALAKDIDESWEECQSIDWSEAEQLHRNLEAFLKANPQSSTTELAAIVNYGKKEADWDSGEVSNWPQIIMAELPGE